MNTAALRRNYAEVRARLWGNPPPSSKPAPVAHERFVMRMPADPPKPQPRIERAMPASVKDVIFAVAEKHNVRAWQIVGPKRGNMKISTARHEAMWRVRNEILLVCEIQPSLAQIGAWFGNRDHSSVLHSLERWEAHLKRCAG